MPRRVVIGSVRAACIEQVRNLLARARQQCADFDFHFAEGESNLCLVEQLEQRQLLSNAAFSSGVLTLVGPNGQHNTLSVTTSGSNYIGKSNGSSVTVAASQVKSIKIIGGNEADKITLASGVSAPASITGSYGNDTISGGSGNDTITGNTGNDSILGNGGNDKLSGGDGNDYLDGGSGTNSIDGGAGSDIIRNAGSSGSGSASTSSAAITALELWNTDTNTKVQTISSGSVLDLSKLPAHYTFVAQTSSATHSVKFGVDSNSNYHTENQSPWSISGDTNGKLTAWSISTGSHKIVLTPYTKSGASGSAGSAQTFSFTVNRSSSGVSPDGSALSVTAIELWNADTNQKIETLSNGQSLDLANLPSHLSILAQGSSGVASIRFGVDSSSNYHVESQKPWAIAGDNNGDLTAWTIPTGSHTISATPYSKNGATGSAGSTDSVKLNITRSSGGSSGGSTAMSVTGIELWNADTNQKIQTLSNNQSLNLASLPAHLSIVAQGSSAVASVKFGVDSNSNYHVESQKPWAIAGDNNGDLAAWTFPTGAHTISVTPFSKNGATGTAGSTDKITLNITAGSTTGGSTGTGSSGIQPRNSSAAAPNAVINFISSKTIHAGQSISVNATSSSLNSGTPLTARYAWDFGDSGSPYNTLLGFNAAHFYDAPGTYTVTLTLTNEAGKTSTARSTVTVQSAGRQSIYVSNEGSDSNSGTSSSAPIKSFSKAASKVAGKSNIEILFKGGETFTTSAAMPIYGQNVVVGSYGSGRATIKYTGPKNYTSVIWLGANAGGQDTVRDLIMDSSYTSVSDAQGMPQAVGISGVGDTVINCEFLNLDYAVNLSAGPSGVLIEGNTAPLRTGLREYFVWSQGNDVSIIGNNISNTLFGHDIRSGGTDRLLIADNYVSNPNDAQYGDSTNRGTIDIHTGTYQYITGNTFDQGVTSVGPLGQGDGLNDKGARLNYVVFEDNRVQNSLVIVLHGTQHYMARNNVIQADAMTGFEIQGYSSTYGRGVVDANIMNNTVIDNDTDGNFIRVDGSVDGIDLINNLYIAPHFVTGTSGASPVYVVGSNLSSFGTVTGNVWPSPTILQYAQGGINYVWPTWSNAAGYLTPSEWDSLGQVGTDYFQDTSFNSSTDAPSTSSQAASAGVVAAGVFTDKNGKVRPSSGSSTAGAVEV